MSRRPQWVALAVLLAAPATARACPEPTAAATALPEAVRPTVTAARELAARGDCEAAAAASTSAYDALAGQPRRHLEALHALLADVVHLQLAAHHARARASRPPPPGTTGVTDPAQQHRPLCAADTLVLRHRARVRAIGRASPGFESTIAGLRGELHLRLAGAVCPAQVPGDAVVAMPLVGVTSTGYRSDLLLRPGQLSAETRERRPPPPSGPRWRHAKRGGVAMMTLGLMALGGGIAAGAIDIPRQGALQGGLLVAGTALFVGGFPLLILADQRTRAETAVLAVGPGGARLSF